jgi:uncharacterized protein (UPF0548 family)
VGGTSGPLLLGYRHALERRRLASGRAVFDGAVERLMSWEMHERSGLGVESSSSLVHAGTAVLLRFRLGHGD